MADQPASAPTPVLLLLGVAGFLVIAVEFGFALLASSAPTLPSQPAAAPTDGSRLMPQPNEPGVVTPPAQTRPKSRPDT